MASKTVSVQSALEGRPTWFRNVLEYVTLRQNPDGDYMFAQGADSGAQDTYYALSILQRLGAVDGA